MNVVILHSPFPLRSAFLALPLEGDAKRTFQALQETLQPWESILRFQNPASSHLTLTFWKELMEIEYEPVCLVARAIAERSRPFTLETTGMDTFADRRGDRVLYLSVQFSPELASLKKLCPWPNFPGKPFHPHVTVARIAHPERFAVVKKKIMRALDGAIFPMTCDRLRLYAEIEGKQQTPLEEYTFAQD